MKNWILTAVVLSLTGLIVVQVVLLGTGLRLEKQRFDEKVKRTMYEVQQSIGRQEKLSRGVAELSVISEDYYLTKKDSLYLGVEQQIEFFFAKKLSAESIGLIFSFAISDETQKKVFIASSNFDQLDQRFSHYKILLEGKVIQKCHCILVLHLKIDNLFNYLLRQLAYLIIPSVLFILVILGSLSFLIYTLNKQKQLDQIKNDFINNLTHELKTPVFSISLTSKVLKESVRQNKPEKSQHLLSLIDKESEKLKTHINKVLELASLEGKQHILQKENYDIHALIEEVAQDFSFKVAAKNGTLHQELKASSFSLKIDKTHFSNVLQNLLENALKYNLENPNIKIKTHNEGDKLVISIQDNGIGISAEHQKYIFEKFYRVSTGDVHVVKGFGLGLNYVKQIVEAHGGIISVESQLDKGSQFKITMA